MKYFYSALLVFLFVASQAFAEEANLSNIQIEVPEKHASADYDQLLSLQIGAFNPTSIRLNNGAYQFDYGNNLSSVMGEAQWALKLFDLGGSFYIQEGLAFSSFGGNAVQGQGIDSASGSYSLTLFGFDTRLAYAAEWFPWKRLIPFVDGGYMYSIYFQPGSSGMDSISGGVGNAVAGAGLNFWLNRDASLAGAHPIFLTGKFNQVFASSNSVNLASSSFLGGISLGI